IDDEVLLIEGWELEKQHVEYDSLCLLYWYKNSIYVEGVAGANGSLLEEVVYGSFVAYTNER
ncbi:hypothetical protein Moror_4308, partial [Moniliophthora roreri MCA 2997]